MTLLSDLIAMETDILKLKEELPKLKKRMEVLKEYYRKEEIHSNKIEIAYEMSNLGGKIMRMQNELDSREAQKENYLDGKVAIKI